MDIIEIISGKLSAILEMIWNIIDITEISTVKYKEWEGQEGLLMWVRDIIGPYDLIATEFEKR